MSLCFRTKRKSVSGISVGRGRWSRRRSAIWIFSRKDEKPKWISEIEISTENEIEICCGICVWSLGRSESNTWNHIGRRNVERKRRRTVGTHSGNRGDDNRRICLFLCHRRLSPGRDNPWRRLVGSGRRRNDRLLFLLRGRRNTIGECRNRRDDDRDRKDRPT